MIHIEKPYLPAGKVKLYIANTPIEDADVIFPPLQKELPEGINRHADLGICIVSETKAVCPPVTFDYYKETLSPYGFEIIKGKKTPGCHYPDDTAYNVCVVGKKCFLNINVCDSTLFDILTSEGYEIINVKQGYAKCSVCPIDENTIITADASISKAAAKKGMEVLMISNDKIILPGYDNGFFGGCTGMGDKNLLIINGEIETLPEAKIIRDFLHKKGIEIKELKKGPPVDIGSIIPLMTK